MSSTRYYFVWTLQLHTIFPWQWWLRSYMENVTISLRDSDCSSCTFLTYMLHSFKVLVPAPYFAFLTYWLHSFKVPVQTHLKAIILGIYWNNRWCDTRAWSLEYRWIILKCSANAVDPLLFCVNPSTTQKFSLELMIAQLHGKCNNKSRRPRLQFLHVLDLHVAFIQSPGTSSIFHLLDLLFSFIQCRGTAPFKRNNPWSTTKYFSFMTITMF